MQPDNPAQTPEVNMLPRVEDVVAIALADMHLSLTPPIARAEEPDWFAAMRRVLDEITFVANYYEVPVLCAGDIFHHWKSSPELINFAIEYMPPMYAIPGQHDLPLHQIADIKRSAYWTLVQAGKVNHVTPVGTYHTGPKALRIFGFPWDVPVEPMPVPDSTGWWTNIALVHAYMHVGEKTCFQGAGAEGHYTGKRHPHLTTYDTVVIGDNHIPWDIRDYENDGKATHIYNCGGLYRRNADQAEHKPSIGLITRNGTVVRHYLDTGADVLTTAAEVAPDLDLTRGFENFLDNLTQLQGADLDFPTTIKHHMVAQRVPQRVQKLILEALEHGNSNRN